MKITRLSAYLVDKGSLMNRYIDERELKILLENYFSDLGIYLRQFHIESSDIICNVNDIAKLEDVDCDMSHIEKHFQKPISTMKRKIYVGRYYRHFKGKKVKVLAISRHTEFTNMLFVVYEYGGIVWSRPYDMFISEVDKEKYPNVKQKYRFELIN